MHRHFEIPMHGRKPNAKVHEQIIALKGGGCSIAETARLAGVSVSQVKRVWAQNQAKVKIGYLGEGAPKTASEYMGDY
ncbi:hypothetical protein BKM20_28620 [Pseudomonas avellanae]|uniref:Resolvase HTH domain-containing protein n=3 Tax=Pseudomonas syringae group TaxID=136849 RepID=A0A330JWA8_9PSED|nr:hypothetical protein AL055_22375 [Pseudomonas amygdali pv. morsprunorum]PHN49692.1 hypothetical protein AO261_10670 [Pseudomonas avellanae]POC81908.1 hypothetical protein BKM26_28015 [Pseudomonas avellanae]POC98545.1 hypothetical protein BKM20_28620 [Pseudomonas avellanae]SPD89650.1 hypothetical protein PSCFBP3800_P200014 [Pseudomonas syringae group genomosp. 3]